ncbi:MAG: hypothetical protein CMK49_02395 [Prochlorococcus sp. SP3034]|nr:hypothetical protein [Prochlorococcus sp. SP3034]|tara:strand:- start:7616 stop:8254 length:639 start_codon:yes stop_codon:yes gene_type:complete
MKITNKSEALNIIEPSYLASLSSLLWIALYYLPVGGALLRLILPLPLILLHLRRGSKIALDGIIIQILLLVILMGPIRGPLFLFPYGLLAFWLGWCWLNAKSWWISWILGIIIGAFGFSIRVFALSTLVGENLWIIITRASYSLIEKLSNFLNISSSPSLLSIQIVAILLIIFQEIVYVFTIHIIAYSIFPRLKSRLPDPPLILSGIVDFKI